MSKNHTYNPEPRVNIPYNSWIEVSDISEPDATPSWEESQKKDYEPGYFSVLLESIITTRSPLGDNSKITPALHAKKDGKIIQRHLEELRANITRAPEEMHTIIIPYYNETEAGDHQYGAVMLASNPHDAPGKVTTIYIGKQSANTTPNVPAELRFNNLKNIFKTTDTEDKVAVPLNHIADEETGSAVIHFLRELSDTRSKDEKKSPSAYALLNQPKELQERLCTSLKKLTNLNVVRKNQFVFFEPLAKGDSADQGASTATQKTTSLSKAQSGPGLKAKNTKKTTDTADVAPVTVSVEQQQMLDQIKKLEADTKAKQAEIKKIEDKPLDLKKQLGYGAAAGFAAFLIFTFAVGISAGVALLFVVGALVAAAPTISDLAQKYSLEKGIEKNSGEIETLKEDFEQQRLAAHSAPDSQEASLLGNLAPSTTPANKTISQKTQRAAA